MNTVENIQYSNSEILQISVTNGTFSISKDDWEKVKNYKWYINKYKGRVVAPSKSPNQPSTLYLHRLILNAPNNLVVDHIDGDPLNNVRSNLRLVSQKQNTWNQRAQKNSKVSFRGVTKLKDKFMASITANRCSIHLGLFETSEEAASAYDQAAKLLYGEHYVRPNLNYDLKVKLENESVLRALKGTL